MKRIFTILLSVVAMAFLLPNSGQSQAIQFTYPLIAAKPVPTGYVYGMSPAFSDYYYSSSLNMVTYLYGPDQDNMLISDDGLGGCVIVFWNYYSYNSSTGQSTYYYIWANRIDASGNFKWNGQTGIWPIIPNGSYGSYGYQWTPRIQGDANGGAYITCNGQDLNNGSRYRLFIQHVGPTGTLLWGQNGYALSGLAGAGDYAYYYYPSFKPTMDPDGNGGVFVTFNCYNTSNTYGNLYACRILYSASSSTPIFGWNGGAVTLMTGSSTNYISSSTSYGGSYPTHPIIRSSKDGGAWVVWISYGTSSTPYYRMNVAKVNSSGTIQSNVQYTDIWYSSYYPYVYNQLHVEADGTGGVVIAYGFYYDYATAAYTARGNQYYYYGWDYFRCTWTGSSISRTTPVLCGSPNDMYASYYGYYKGYNGRACSDSAGGLMHSYCEYYASNGTYAYDLYAQKMSNNAPQWNASSYPTGTALESTTGTGYEFNSCMNDGSGNMLVAWMYASYSYSSSNPLYINKLKGSDGSKLWASSSYLQFSQSSGYYSSNQYYMYYQSYPYMCQDGAGGAWVAWDGYMNDYTNGSYTDFYILVNHVQDTAAAPHAQASAAAQVGAIRVCPTACAGTTVTNAVSVKDVAGSNPSIQAAVKIIGPAPTFSLKGYCSLSGSYSFPYVVPIGSAQAFSLNVKAPFNGNWTDSVYFMTNDPLHSVIGIGVNGSGKYPHITANDTANMPKWHVGTTYNRTVTVTNTGTDYLTITGATITGGDASNFAIVGSPNQVINPGAQGTISLSFTPSSAIPKIANLNIMSDDSQYLVFNNPKVMQLTGQGIFPHVTASNSLAFPFVVAGLRTKTLGYLITNSGTENLVISNASNVTGTNASEFSIVAPPLPITIAPGASNTLQVKFAPNAILGDRVATMNVVSNFDSACAPPNAFPCNAFAVALTGTGVDGAPDLQYVNQDFGTIHVATKDTMTVHLLNTVDATKVLQIQFYQLTGPFASSFTMLNAPTTLPDAIPIGGTRDIKIEFNATRTGQLLGYLHMLTNAQATPIDIALYGTGAKGQLVASSIDFGKVAISDYADDTLTFTNLGNWPLTVSSFAFVGAGGLSYTPTGTMLGATLRPNESKIIPVRFMPAAIGTYNIQVRLITTDNDTVFVAVNGKGVNKGVLYAPVKDTFDLVAINVTTNRPIHIVNSGDVPVHITDLHFINATAPLAFSVNAPLPLDIAPGADTYLSVLFNTNTGGEKTATLVIAADNNLGGRVDLIGFASADPFDAAPRNLSSTLSDNGPHSEQHSVTLRNFTTTPDSVMNLMITGRNANAFRIVAPISWPFEISGQSTQIVTVAFEPQKFGTFVATLEMTMNDGRMIPVSLNGTYGPSDVRTDNPIPAYFSLSQNYPNPFNGATQITYQLPERTPVTLGVYDVMGRLVTEVVNGTREAGVYSVSVNGDALPTGVYTYVLRVNGLTQSHLMQVVK